MTHSFNIPELYRKIFGVESRRFDIPKQNEGASSSANIGYNLEVPISSRAHAFSYLGTPIYEQITFSLPGIENLFTFPDWPLMDISAGKLIVKTPMKGKNGTIKEFINTDDYQIRIRGILINYESDEYPEELVEQLHSVFQLNTSLRVTNPLLNLLDVNEVVIQGLKLPEVEGYNNIQPYVIEAISEMSTEVSITYAQNQKKVLPPGG